MSERGLMTARQRADRRAEDRARALEAYRGPVQRIVEAVAPGWALRRMLTRMTLDAVYRAATDRRIRRSGNPQGGSGDDHARERDLYSLREQSRDGEMNNALVGGILDRCVDNVVGPVITPQAQSADDGWNRAAEEWWDEWSRVGSDPSVSTHVDITGTMPMGMMQRVGFRSVLRDGDCGFLLTEDGQVQPVEADRIVTPAGRVGVQRDGSRVVNGVELDRVNRPMRYWVGDPTGRLDVFATKADPVDARNFILLRNPRRFTTTRGVPVLHALLEHFDQLDQYIEAEIVGAKVSAMLTAFVSQRDAAMAAALRASAGQDNDGNAVNYERLSSGLIMYGEPGEGVDIISGNRPNANFPEFVVFLLRVIGINLGLPLELVALDFSRTNYSSARASLLQAYRMFKCWQQFLVECWMDRLWRWRIGRAIALGELSRVENALAPKWLVPGWPWVDPLDEIRADALAIDRGFKSLITVSGEQGRDWEGTLEDKARVIRTAERIAAALRQELKITVVWQDIIGAGQVAAQDAGKGTEKVKQGA